MALPLPVIPPQPDAFHLAPHRIKRCTFRRLINVEVGSERVYDVECLYPDRKVPIPKDAQPEEFWLAYAANEMAKQGWEAVNLNSRRILFRRVKK